MSKEEIRKLLGGYATNTLTESERSALFEAALDDQELFDALQQEQALKDVLADPRARAEIRQALDHPHPKRAPWWSWGGAIASAAAAAVLIAVFWPRSSPVLEKPVEIAAAKKLPSPASPAQAFDALKQSSRQAPPATFRKPMAPNSEAAATSGAAPVPAPIISSPVISQAVQPAPPQAQGAVALSQNAEKSDQLTTLSGALNRTRLATPLLAYTLVKQAAGKDLTPIAVSGLKSGDQVRFRVSSADSGVVTLTQLDPAGVWQPIGSVAAQADSSYLLPSGSIVVTADAQRFRLAFAPSRPQAKAAESRAQLSAPVVLAPIEITIVANPR